jgi:enoyl-CoA hydratase
MTGASPLLDGVQDHVLTLTFNRPEKLNAITSEMLELMAVQVDRFRRDADLRVMLLMANGRYYSSGMDISSGIAPETESGIEFRDWYRRSFHVLFDELEAIEKPVVSAIQGACLGGALEMALSSDFRLASDKATFALPETNIGALPGSGGISRLTRLIGVAETKWMVMAAQGIDAHRALRVGLVHEVYPAEDFQQKCREFAKHLCSLPPEVVGAAKLTIDLAKDLDRSSGRSIERIVNTPLSQSKVHRELISQFIRRKD